MGDHRGSPGAVYFLHFHRPHIHKLFYSLFLDNTAMLVSFFYYTTLNLPTDYIFFSPNSMLFFPMQAFGLDFLLLYATTQALVCYFCITQEIIDFSLCGHSLTHGTRACPHKTQPPWTCVFFCRPYYFLSHTQRPQRSLPTLSLYFSLTPRTSVCV